MHNATNDRAASIHAPMGFAKASDVQPDTERAGMLRAPTHPIGNDIRAVTELKRCQLWDWNGADAQRLDLEEMGFEDIDLSDLERLQSTLEGVRRAGRVTPADAAATPHPIDVPMPSSQSGLSTMSIGSPANTSITCSRAAPVTTTMPASQCAIACLTACTTIGVPSTASNCFGAPSLRDPPAASSIAANEVFTSLSRASPIRVSVAVADRRRR